MTLSKNVMTHLVDRAQQQYDSACQLVARTQNAIETAMRTKRTLDQFVSERANSRRDRSNISVSVDSLRTESDFAGKLSRAVDSQARSLFELERARDANNTTLVTAHRHLDVMKSLQNQMREHEMQAEKLAEQRESDEHAARMTYTGQNSAYSEQENQ